MRVRVLFLAANPVDTDRLRLDKEIRTIDERIQQGGNRDSIELLSHWAVQTGGLPNLLMREKPHVVHFSGHGSVEGVLLESRSGESQVGPPDAVAELFRILKDNIQCVVLNACYSEGQAKAIARYIDVVIGTSAAIGDDDAISFASGFYRAISDGRNLQDAFDLGVVEGQLLGLNIFAALGALSELTIINLIQCIFQFRDDVEYFIMICSACMPTLLVWSRLAPSGRA